MHSQSPFHSGPKAFGAAPSSDNGFMRLDRVRVPLSAMLSKFANITKEGKYMVPVHSKLGYGGVSHPPTPPISPSHPLTQCVMIV